MEVDLFLTGEMSHHEILAANAQGTSVILCEHSNSERGYLKQVLQPKLEVLAFHFRLFTFFSFFFFLFLFFFPFLF